MAVRKKTQVKIGSGFGAAGEPLSPQETQRRAALTKESLDRTKRVKDPNAVTADEASIRAGLAATPSERAAQLAQNQATSTQDIQDAKNVQNTIQGIVNPQPQPQMKRIVDEQGNVQMVPETLINYRNPDPTHQVERAQAQNDALAWGATVSAEALAAGAIGGGLAGLAPAAFTAPTIAIATESTSAGLTALGTFKSLVGGTLVATAFHLITSGKQRAFKDNLSNLNKSSKTWVALAQHDPDEALHQVELIESNMVDTLGKLHVAYLNDPQARLKGEDIEAIGTAYLLQIQRHKALIRNYQKTGNLAALQSGVAQITQEELLDGSQ